MLEDAATQTQPILVGTDLSEPSDAAIVCAHSRAARVNAPLVVLHVLLYAPALTPLYPMEYFGTADQLLALEQKARQQLAERVQRLTGRGPDTCQVLVEFGHPYATIIERAEKLQTRLIVVANRGASGLERIMLGSVAEKVVRHAHCPVLVMRPGNDTGPVLAATDLSDAAVPAVKTAAEEARARGLRLYVLHDLELWPGLSSVMAPLGPVPFAPDADTVQKVRDAASDMLAGVLERLNTEAEQRVTMEGNPAAAILHAAEELGASIVVVATRGRTGLARLALGSVAETVVRHSHCSVLAVRSTQNN
jgi:nucleotide-binding universal stress UspA family protein